MSTFEQPRGRAKFLPIFAAIVAAGCAGFLLGSYCTNWLYTRKTVTIPLGERHLQVLSEPTTVNLLAAVGSHLDAYLVLNAAKGGVILPSEVGGKLRITISPQSKISCTVDADFTSSSKTGGQIVLNGNDGNLRICSDHPIQIEWMGFRGQTDTLFFDESGGKLAFQPTFWVTRWDISDAPSGLWEALSAQWKK